MGTAAFYSIVGRFREVLRSSIDAAMARAKSTSPVFLPALPARPETSAPDTPASHPPGSTRLECATLKHRYRFCTNPQCLSPTERRAHDSRELMDEPSRSHGGRLHVVCRKGGASWQHLSGVSSSF